MLILHGEPSVFMRGPWEESCHWILLQQRVLRFSLHNFYLLPSSPSNYVSERDLGMENSDICFFLTLQHYFCQSNFCVSVLATTTAKVSGKSSSSARSLNCGIKAFGIKSPTVVLWGFIQRHD